MAGTIAGTISTTILGVMLAKYDKDDSEPQNAGYILGGVVLFSYLSCGPLFLLSGHEYKKELELRKAKMIAEGNQGKEDDVCH